MSQKTVFISYRRDDAGMLLAQLLETKLTQLGYDVFLDVASMESGKWDAQILTNIPRSAHFLLLLTPGALDRCCDPGDWVRREYETAVRHGRNVVPLAWNGLDIGAMRQAADPSMRGLFAYQIAELHHKTLTGDLEKLTANYIAPHHAPKEPDSSRRHTIPVDITRILKYAPTHLIGREAELAQLDAAWKQAVNGENPRPRILTFVALGGEGKTSLVAKWAAGLAENGWPGADAVFA